MYDAKMADRSASVAGVPHCRSASAGCRVSLTILFATHRQLERDTPAVKVAVRR